MNPVAGHPIMAPIVICPGGLLNLRKSRPFRFEEGRCPPIGLFERLAMLLDGTVVGGLDFRDVTLRNRRVSKPFVNPSVFITTFFRLDGSMFAICFCALLTVLRNERCYDKDLVHRSPSGHRTVSKPAPSDCRDLLL